MKWAEERLTILRLEMLNSLGVTFLLALCGAQTAGDKHLPKSGFIHTATYGKLVEPQSYSRIWFTSTATREDFLEGNVLYSSGVLSASEDWSAFPACGRIEERKPREFKTYPERIRESFASFFAKKSKTADTFFNGHRAWKYNWHEPARQAGDVGSAAADLTFWLLANPSFPVTLKSESSPSGRMEMLLLKLDVPVDEAVFQKPKGLKLVRRFELPQRVFRITIEERQRNIAGTDRITRLVFKGDGEVVTITAEARDATATTPDFKAQPRQLSYLEVAGEIWRYLQTPHWSMVKRVESTNLLGIESDRLVSRIPSVDYEWTVADHPVLGTITLEQIAKFESNSRTLTVKSIDFY